MEQMALSDLEIYISVFCFAFGIPLLLLAGRQKRSNSQVECFKLALTSDSFLVLFANANPVLSASVVLTRCAVVKTKAG